MIKFIKKRNGQLEAFDRKKANHLVDWAEQNMAGRCDISGALYQTVYELGEVATSSEFNNAIIKRLLNQQNWAASVMAGRVYAFEMRKTIYPEGELPNLYDLHKEMMSEGMIVDMGYTVHDYEQFNRWLKHDRDLEYPEFALNQLRNKYAISNKITGKEYETPQYTYMRMAMALAEKEPIEKRNELVKDFYEVYSQRELSSPTPNYTNLGTKLRGYASCCLFAVGDTNESIRAGMVIANDMTVNSAGLGMLLQVRSAGDPVRGGLFKHRGKRPYYESFGKITKQNIKNGRDGAMTAYFQAFDPEASMVMSLRSPLTPIAEQNRDIHHAMQLNAFFVQKALRNEDIMTYNSYTAPELFEAMYSKDIKHFIDLYNKHENDPSFKKKYVSARKLVAESYCEAFDTGTSYLFFADEVNRHTPFLEPIRQSNLCAEVALVTKPYVSLDYLYDSSDHGMGEIAMCNLAAIPVDRVDFRDVKNYMRVCYLALKSIDRTIHLGSYPYPHLEFTAKQRMNAGVGVMGLAHLFAREGLKYSRIESKILSHQIAETHAFCMISASLQIAKERGPAPWIDKTKWPQGWLPIDTYNRGVDEIYNFKYLHDWEGLRKEIIKVGGIAHSSLINLMPGESSSKALATPNSVYGVRDPVLMKRDGSNTLNWFAPDSDILKGAYDGAFEIPTFDMIDHYAIWQKFTDQAISADLWKKWNPGETTVAMPVILDELKYMVKRGIKTRYYLNNRRPLGNTVGTKLTSALVSSSAKPSDINLQAFNNSMMLALGEGDGVQYVDTLDSSGCEGSCKL